SLSDLIFVSKHILVASYTFGIGLLLQTPASTPIPKATIALIKAFTSFRRIFADKRNSIDAIIAQKNFFTNYKLNALSIHVRN
ncbi:MAG: hypothetical protein IJQ16_09530, partial [Selenomonadaceae bacterium]|nr:hypothetical protein [Selenomonadaceae bacterium]